ncbi:membrane protein insertion efficiency factor YidD [Petrocella atlantisensis]|uniref:membrane protein insertion efficiency factor YidD n=1 Tax=Petrocella atlantisensis TaxID=2173034 RepID=UPI000F63E575|nr:membrane protein insertion efficiency factor YidD [Petrocella atlantisensis]MCF8020222.1 membrane protein insertion efficiency factor YidD [Vallitaleaceae bacterium]
MKRIAISIVLFYRKFISPLTKSSCIYIPTCSMYALEALEKYGFFKGSYLSIKRILRCHPFAKGGFDPLK